MHSPTRTTWAVRVRKKTQEDLATPGFEWIGLRSLHRGVARLPRRIALAATLAVTTSTATTATHAEVGGIILAFAVIPFGVVIDSITRLAAFKVWALLDVGEDILAAIPM